MTVWQMVSACYRIALAAETGRLRGHIVTQNLTFAAHKGAKLVSPAEEKPRHDRPGALVESIPGMGR